MAYRLYFRDILENWRSRGRRADIKGSLEPRILSGYFGEETTQRTETRIVQLFIATVK